MLFEFYPFLRPQCISHRIDAGVAVGNVMGPALPFTCLQL